MVMKRKLNNITKGLTSVDAERIARGGRNVICIAKFL
jgi:hypothetical protein